MLPYKQLCEEPDDLIGLLAYGRYKEQKIIFIEDFEKRNTQRPTDEDFEEFHRSSASHIQYYRKDAERQLAEIVERIIQERMDVFSKQQEKIQHAVLKGLKSTFLGLSWAGIVGGLAYSLLLAAVVFAIAGGQLNIIVLALKGLGVDLSLGKN